MSGLKLVCWPPGGRTNPWFQECSDRVIQVGDMFSYDTDLIGPFGYWLLAIGYCADLSRSHVCGPVKASSEQKRLYRLAYEQIEYNMEILKPGMTFKEYTDKAWQIPDEFISNRYGVMAHGVGMCDEWPAIRHSDNMDNHGYDGLIQPGMTLCVESYIGSMLWQ